jgi:hypothetical protein
MIPLTIEPEPKRLWIERLDCDQTYGTSRTYDALMEELSTTQTVETFNKLRTEGGVVNLIYSSPNNREILVTLSGNASRDRYKFRAFLITGVDDFLDSLDYTTDTDPDSKNVSLDLRFGLITPSFEVFAEALSQKLEEIKGILSNGVCIIDFQRTQDDLLE